MIEIISGGQSGVDRAALEAATDAGHPCGGWCPRGGWAEDAPVPPGIRTLYPALKETPSRDTAQRTEWNVRDSDAVLALIDQRGLGVSVGTSLAIGFAETHAKPCLILDIADPAAEATAVDWLEGQPQPLRLNIVGPRESEAPGIGAASRRFIGRLLASGGTRR